MLFLWLGLLGQAVACTWYMQRVQDHLVTGSQRTMLKFGLGLSPKPKCYRPVIQPVVLLGSVGTVKRWGLV